MGVAENYPDLKANENFLGLQRELVDTEDRIQVTRRIYNANVRVVRLAGADLPVADRRPPVPLRRAALFPGRTRGAWRGPPSVDLSEPG